MSSLLYMASEKGVRVMPDVRLMAVIEHRLNIVSDHRIVSLKR